MNKAFLLLIIAVTIISCSSKQEEKTEKSITEIAKNNSDHKQIVTPSDSGIVKLSLIDGKGTVKTFKKKNQTIYIEFLSEKYKRITAHISSPDTLANIRISQIFLPDGTMDGPFGKDMECQLPMDGLYKISINENMMAGDPWSGIVWININLTL